MGDGCYWSVGEDPMMQRISKWANFCLLGLATIVGVRFVLMAFANTLASGRYVENIKGLQGEVVAMNQLGIVVKFEEPLVRTNGDNEILASLVDASGLEPNLRSITIPKNKTERHIKGDVIIFTLGETAAFIQEEVYALEVSIRHSKYSQDYIT